MENTLMSVNENPFTEISLKEEITQQNDSFCSMKAETAEEKADLFNATNNPAHRISDYINGAINVKDIFCEVVNVTNKETGETSTCPRIVLIDEKGEGYQAVSYGVFSALKKMMAVYGLPTWEPAIPIKIQQITKDKNKMLTFSVVRSK